MEQLATNYQVVEIDQIIPNDWNPKKDDPDKYAEVVKSVRAYGLRAPITVREFKGGYQIIDGFHRWKACKDLGYTKVVINNLGDVPDDEAKRLTIVFQKVNVPFDEVMYASLLKSLSEELDKDDLLKTLPVNEEELEGYLKMSEFDWQDFEGDEILIKETDSDVTLEADRDTIKEIRELIAKRKKESKDNRKLVITAVRNIQVLKEQANIIFEALDKVQNEDEAYSPGRALELICADYLAGAKKE